MIQTNEVPSLFLPVYDYREGRYVRQFARPAATMACKGRFKVQVVDARSKKVIHERPWQRNLILDAGLDQLATTLWTDLFLYCAAGTGNTPTSDTSGATTASQAGTTVTASAGFFAGGDVGKLIRWAGGSEAKITVFTDTTHVTVDRSQTVSSGTFTMYRVNQTGLTTEVSGASGRTGTYLTGSGNCGTSRSGSAFTHTRTYDFAAPSGSTNYAEVGVSWSATQAANLFSRMLISGGTVTVLTSQQLRVIYQLQITMSPTTPNSKTASITGWPISPATDTNGTEQIGHAAISSINTNGGTVAFDDPDEENEPSKGSTGAYIFISTDAQAHGTFPASPDRSTGATGKIGSLGTYTNGNFFRDKTVTFNANEANSTNYRSIGLGSNSSNSVGFAFLFGQAQTKANTFTLQLTFRLTWARDLS